MSSISEMHKAKAKSLFTYYMGEATGFTEGSDAYAEWDEIIDRVIDAAVAEAKEIYAATPAVAQDDPLDRIASALERIANVLEGETGGKNATLHYFASADALIASLQPGG